MKRLLIAPLALAAALAGGAVRIVQDQCGPFTDVTPAFCPYILELYYLGITAGTSATTFSPDDPLTRGQAAVFVAKGFNQSLGRGSRRAALGQWWTTTPHDDLGLGVTTIGGTPRSVRSDGADLWVADDTNGTISRVRGSDGTLLETWTGASGATDVLVAMGRVFAGGAGFPSSLYMLDPSQPAGAVTTIASDIPPHPLNMAYDGSRIWTANLGGSVSIVTPGGSLPWTLTNVTTGFSSPFGIVFDGSHVWVTDVLAGTLLELDAAGGILRTVNFGAGTTPKQPAFDGANLWVPLGEDSVAVVRASDGAVLTTLTGNGIAFPAIATFDGQRILVSNNTGNSISLWRAADLTPLGSFTFATGAAPFGVCSDGVNFWIALKGSGQLARF